MKLRQDKKKLTEAEVGILCDAALTFGIGMPVGYGAIRLIGALFIALGVG